MIKRFLWVWGVITPRRLKLAEGPVWLKVHLAGDQKRRLASLSPEQARRRCYAEAQISSVATLEQYGA